MTRLVTFALCAPIHFYRRFISPLSPPSCRFQPSCSAYALEAIKTHGPARGFVLAVAAHRALPSHHLARRFVGLRSGSSPQTSSRVKISP